MTAVVSVQVDEFGVVRAFDGERHYFRSGVQDVVRVAERLVVYGADVVLPLLRPIRDAPPSEFVVDVRDLARLLGFGDTEDAVFGLIREGVPQVHQIVARRLEAMHRIGCRFDSQIPEGERQAMRRMVRINDNGIVLDRPHASALASEFRHRRDEASRRVRISLPSIDFLALRSEHRFREEVARRFGVELGTTALGKVGGAVGAIVDARRCFIEFDKAANLMADVGRQSGALRNALKYAGASTGRYSSSGRFNILALPKRPHRSLESLKRIRDVVVPPPGHLFVSRDLHAIEARVLSYLSGQDDLVERFRCGADVYAEFASSVWPGIRIEKGGANAHLRDIGKIAVLSLGFGVGFETFSEAVLEDVADVEPRDLRRAYDAFRKTYPRLMGELSAAESALFGVLRGVTHRANVCRAGVNREGDVLYVDLPSGRSLHYRGLAIGTLPNGDDSLWWCRSWSRAPGELGEPEAVPWDRDEHRFADGVVRERFRSHALVNNVVQAVARDIVVHIENELERRGVEVAFTVHDSIVAISGMEYETWAAAHLILKEVMQSVPRTLPQALWAMPIRGEMERAVFDRYA